MAKTVSLLDKRQQSGLNPEYLSRITWSNHNKRDKAKLMGQKKDSIQKSVPRTVLCESAIFFSLGDSITVGFIALAQKGSRRRYDPDPTSFCLFSTSPHIRAECGDKKGQPFLS